MALFLWQSRCWILLNLKRRLSDFTSTLQSQRGFCFFISHKMNWIPAELDHQRSICTRHVLWSKNSLHSPVKTGHPIIQQEQLIISSSGDETMVPCCSELPLYSIHASCCALFAHLPYFKGLKWQHGSAECALWWWANETVIGDFITTIDSGMTDFSPVSVMGLIRSTPITCKVHYWPSLVKALIGAILRVTVIMLFLMYC